MSSVKTVAVLAAVGTMAWAPLGAQTLTPVTPRPEQGYFQRADPTERRLDLNITALGAYDTDLLATDTSQAGATLHSPYAGSYTRTSTAAEFFKRFNRGDVTLTGASTLRYYPSLQNVTGVQHAGAVAVGLQMNRARLNLSQSIEFRPFLSIGVFPALYDGGPAALPAPVADQTTTRREERVLNTAVSLVEPIGRRMSLSFSADMQRGQFLNEQSSQDYGSIGGRFTRNVTRDVSLVAGYTYEDHTNVQRTVSRRTVLQNADVGVDYNKALGRSRRTTVGFTTGTSFIEGMNGGLQRQLRGSARLNREIGRTWHLTSAYNRGVGFLDGFADPFYADAFSLNAGGTLNDRVDLLLTGGFAIGELTSLTTGFRNGNESANASARVRFALSRRIRFSTEYIWYHYNFDATNGLPLGMPPNLNRRGLRAGLDMFIPVVR